MCQASPRFPPTPIRGVSAKIPSALFHPFSSVLWNIHLGNFILNGCCRRPDQFRKKGSFPYKEKMLFSILSEGKETPEAVSVSRSEIPPAPIRKSMGKKYHQELHQLLHPEEYSPEKLRSKWQLSTSTLQEIQVLHKERINVCFASSLPDRVERENVSNFCRKF
ncbi:hypothetical protein CDAR_366891 [Caerostris darwini]|uniref:Uncharacterized protein n=1 Tax=Caerostris darwini TaxID=1538125 RepID=A0AAV4N6N3_9ARAC|nr:hypothetical protein CDAR_366891 [Caerostris darwini]